MVSSALVKRAHLQVTPITPLPVQGFSEGMDASISEECENVKLVVQQAQFTRSFVVSKLSACDVILGIKWFRRYKPHMGWDDNTLLVSHDVPQPVLIRGEVGIPSVPLISHVQAKRELRRGAKAAVIYINPTS